MEVVSRKIMLEMHSLKFNSTELAVIGRMLEDIQQKHPDLLEVTSVDREGALFFVETREMDSRSDMYHPVGLVKHSVASFSKSKVTFFATIDVRAS